jgi:hypothetical protein
VGKGDEGSGRENKQAEGAGLGTRRWWGDGAVAERQGSERWRREDGRNAADSVHDEVEAQFFWSLCLAASDC